MLDVLLTSSAWALEAKYYALAREVIMSRLAAGQPAFDANFAKPPRYEHVGEDGRPALWLMGAPLQGGANLQLPKPDFAASLSLALSGRSGGAVPKGTQVAVIPLQGAMTKRGGYCSYGTKDVVSMLANANNDERVGAIVLDIDSPGGQVDGTEELAAAVKNSAKPVVSYIDGLGASAAYWVAAQSRAIYVNSAATAFVGSIGVLATHVDQTAFLEKMGAKVTVLRADQSTDKAKPNSMEPLTKDLQKQVEAELTAICDTFISAVKAGRGDRLQAKDEKLFTGKVWNGSTALELGLIDKVGTLGEAATYALNLAE